MKVVGEVNNVHKNTKPPKLKPGEVVVYRILCGTVNPDNETRDKVPMQYPETWPIPNKDRIWDENKQDYVDIGVVDRVVTIGGVSTPKYKKLTSRPKESHGLIHCNGGIIEQEEMYEFFELTDHNISKEGRDESKTAVIERIDVVKQSKKEVKEIDSLLEALKFYSGMTPGEMKDFASSLNWSTEIPPDVLKKQVGQFAKNDPEGFKKAWMSKDRDVKAIINQAITADVIRYDTAQHRITLNGQTLIKLDRVEGVDYLTQAADWVNSHKNGDKTLATIKKLMDKPKTNDSVTE
jgi:hypothetical protein